MRPDFVLKLKIALEFTQKYHGRPSFSMDRTSKQMRYEYFTKIAKLWPSKFSKEGLGSVRLECMKKTKIRADAIRLIGCSEEETKKGPLYQACLRIDKTPPYTLDPSIIPNMLPSESSLPPTSINTSLSSPATSMSSLSFTSNESLLSTDQSLSTSTSLSFTSCNNSILPPKCRLTSRQAHEVRKENAHDKLRRNIAHQLATTMVKEYKNGLVPFMKSATHIVEAVNKMVSEDDGEKVFVTVNEVIESVKEGNIGCGPRKKVRTGRLPKGAFEHLSDLFFPLESYPKQIVRKY